MDGEMAGQVATPGPIRRVPQPRRNIFERLGLRRGAGVPSTRKEAEPKQPKVEDGRLIRLKRKAEIDDTAKHPSREVADQGIREINGTMIQETLADMPAFAVRREEPTGVVHPATGQEERVPVEEVPHPNPREEDIHEARRADRRRALGRIDGALQREHERVTREDRGRWVDPTRQPPVRRPDDLHVDMAAIDVLQTGIARGSTTWNWLADLRLWLEADDNMPFDGPGHENDEGSPLANLRRLHELLSNAINNARRRELTEVTSWGERRLAQIHERLGRLQIQGVQDDQGQPLVIDRPRPAPGPGNEVGEQIAPELFESRYWNNLIEELQPAEVIGLRATYLAFIMARRQVMLLHVDEEEQSPEYTEALEFRRGAANLWERLRSGAELSRLRRNPGFIRDLGSTHQSTLERRWIFRVEEPTPTRASILQTMSEVENVIRHWHERGLTITRAWNSIVTILHEADLLEHTLQAEADPIAEAADVAGDNARNPAPDGDGPREAPDGDVPRGEERGHF